MRSNKRPFAGGGFGKVWLEHEEANPKNVRAVKIIEKPKTQRGFQIEYEQELYALAALSKHQDSFCVFQGWWDDDYDVFLGMEYFPHRDLTNCINTELPESEVRDITSQILEALAILHRMGITHRDLKPQNILVVEPGPSWWVKIGDFGISKRIGQGSALHTRQIGTIAYMAPEVLDEDSNEAYTNAVDMWAVGCIAYSLLTFNNIFTDRKAIRLYGKGEFSLEPAWQQLSAKKTSSMGVNFLKSLLSPIAESRPSAARALESAWIKSQPPAEEKQRVISGTNLEETNATGASTSLFGFKNPFKRASFVTVSDSSDTTGSQYTSATKKSDAGSFSTITQSNTSNSESQPWSPSSTAMSPGIGGGNSQGCNARCQCAICLSCSWSVMPNSTRSEQVMHSCGTGCFGTQPLCTDCMRQIDGGIYVCPRCREVPDETYTRKGHKPAGLFAGNSGDTPKAKGSATQPQTSPVVQQPRISNKAEQPPATPKASDTAQAKAPISSPGPPLRTSPASLSQQPTLVNPPPTLESIAETLGSLVLSLDSCGICYQPTGNEYWSCNSFHLDNRPKRTCLRCMPRNCGRPVGLKWQMTCMICFSEECYLVESNGPPLPLSGIGPMPYLSPLSLYPNGSTPRCTDTCKCDKCGGCAFVFESHWKCKLCSRPRCSTCAGTPTKPVPWCSNRDCNSEMMSPAVRNKLEVLAPPVATGLINMFRQKPLRIACITLGCSCDQCGECSRGLYTYMCIFCTPVGFTTSKHICGTCIRQPLRLEIREQPTCPYCMGIRFRVYEPKSSALLF